MRFQPRPDVRERDRLAMTALIDIVFLLLIFFVVVTTRQTGPTPESAAFYGG